MTSAAATNARTTLLAGLTLAAAWIIVVAPMQRRNRELALELDALAAARESIQPIVTACAGDPRDLLATLDARAGVYRDWFGDAANTAALFERLGDEASRFRVTLERVAPEPTRVDVIDRAANATMRSTRAVVQLSGSWDAVRAFIAFLEGSGDNSRLAKLRLVSSDRGVRAEIVLVQHDLAGLLPPEGPAPAPKPEPSR